MTNKCKYISNNYKYKPKMICRLNVKLFTYYSLLIQMCYLL